MYLKHCQLMDRSKSTVEQFRIIVLNNKNYHREHIQIVKMLLDTGAHINAKDIDGNTPL